MRTSQFLLLIAFGLSPVTGVAQEAAAGPLNRFLDGLETLSAVFEQTMASETGEAVEQSSGTFSIRRPGQFRWTYEQPYAQVIASDGKTIWIYDEDLEQVTIRDAAASIEDSPGAVLGGEVDVDTHYIVVDLGETDGVEWIELTPRDAESEYSSIRLGFDDAELSGMILYDNLGQTTTISFKDVRRNVDLDPGLFKFDPPEGIDVIDSRAAAGG